MVRAGRGRESQTLPNKMMQEVIKKHKQALFDLFRLEKESCGRDAEEEEEEFKEFQQQFSIEKYFSFSCVCYFNHS
jgi:hypothetical protein